MTTEREIRGAASRGGESTRTTAAARERILAATLVTLARYGVAKTTLEDVAKEAGCARATVYRYFGGKAQLVNAVVEHESVRILAAIDASVVDGMPVDDALVAMTTTAAHELLEHDALQFVLAHEPELILPWITFSGGDAFLAATSTALAPTFSRFLPATEAVRAAEWCTRALLAYLGSQQAPIALTEPREVRTLVSEFIAPALRAPATSAEPIRG
jgi:AcrR family transcriptional regulator